MYFFSSNLQRSPWRKKKRGACRPPNGRQAPVARWGGRQGPVFQTGQQRLLNFIKFLQRPKIYCDIFAEGFGNRVRIIMKFRWAMRPLKDDTRETTFHVISNYKLFLSARMSGRCRFHVDLHKPIMIRK